jgi:hypothetical protein
VCVRRCGAGSTSSAVLFAARSGLIDVDGPRGLRPRNRGLPAGLAGSPRILGARPGLRSWAATFGQGYAALRLWMIVDEGRRRATIARLPRSPMKRPVIADRGVVLVVFAALVTEIFDLLIAHSVSLDGDDVIGRQPYA